MTTPQKFPEFISTYQRVLISDWPTMAKLIFKHSCLLKEGGYKEQNFNEDPTNVLSDQQLLDAVQGPYSAFFLSKIKAFSIIARLRMARHIDNEDSLKDNLNPLDKNLELDAKKLADFPKEEVTKIQDAFDELVTDHCQQWEGQLFFWQMSVTGALKSDGLGITEMESDEFASPEPISELLARYDGVNIKPPKVNYPLSFADYFRLKAYLTILSVLSRQHQPHGEKEIEQHMKALKKPLNEIEKQEKDLLKTQESQVAELLQPINFATFKKKK
jgi:hypothetical protein